MTTLQKYLRYLRLIHGHNSIISIEAGSWNTGIISSMETHRRSPAFALAFGWWSWPIQHGGQVSVHVIENGDGVRTNLQQPNPVKGHHKLLYKWSNTAVSKKQSDGETLHCHGNFPWCSTRPKLNSLFVFVGFSPRLTGNVLKSEDVSPNPKSQDTHTFTMGCFWSKEITAVNLDASQAMTVPTLRCKIQWNSVDGWNPVNSPLEVGSW